MSKKLIEPAPEDKPEWVFPYEFMNVGDSFFVPTMRPSHMVYIIDVTSKKVKVKMKAYPSRKDNVLGVRAWRIS